jgi:hypothetical protein
LRWVSDVRGCPRRFEVFCTGMYFSAYNEVPEETRLSIGSMRREKEG